MAVNSGQEQALLVTVGEVARRLGISQRHAWRMIAAGQLPSVLVGGRARRVLTAELDGYISGLRESEGSLGYNPEHG